MGKSGKLSAFLDKRLGRGKKRSLIDKRTSVTNDYHIIGESAAQQTIIEQPSSEAVQTQGRNALQVLNQNGFDTTASRLNWRKALFWAVANDQEDVTRWIITRGTCVQESQYILNTALHAGAKYNRLAIAQMLLDEGANVNGKNSSMETALHIAVMGGHSEMIRLLLKAGADSGAKNTFGKTPRHLAGDHGRAGALLKLFTDDNPVTDGNAVVANNADTDCDPTTDNNLDINDNIYISDNPDIGVSDNFINYGNFVTCNNPTSSSDPNISNKLATANNAGHSDSPIVNNIYFTEQITTQGEITKQHGEKPLLSKAINVERLKVLQILKENGFDTTAPDFDLTKAYSWAVANDQEAVIQWVTDRRKSLQDMEYMLNTKLHTAATYGRLAEVQMLLDQGANANYKNSFGETALHLAAKAGHKEVVRLLLEAGSDGMAKNNDGKTPRHLAGDNGHTGAFLVLHKWLDPGKPYRVERDEPAWHHTLTNDPECRLGAYEYPMPGGPNDARPRERNPVLYHRGF